MSLDVMRNNSTMASEGSEVPSYLTEFPPLISDGRNPSPVSHSQPMNYRSPTSSTTTQVFTIPIQERRFKNSTATFGDNKHKQTEICQEVMRSLGVHLEMTTSKDQSLNILITGRDQDVREAKRQLVNKLQRQAEVSLPVPREYFPAILGKGGQRLHELELQTSTRITLPSREDESNMVKISGNKDGVERAIHEIQVISDEQSKRSTERMNIPKEFHAFIRGPFDAEMKRIAEQTGAKINIPPSSSDKNEIVVSGEKDGVRLAAAELRRIVEAKRVNFSTVQITIPKSQHRFVFGSKGAGIQEILGQTGVYVELPSYESDSEVVSLRGDKDSLGSALTLVYQKANSVYTYEIECPAWLRRYIVGKKGQNIDPILSKYSKVSINFSSEEEKIFVEGPPEEANPALDELHRLVSEVKSKMTMQKIQIDPKYHRFVIGKNGAAIRKIKADTGVEIDIPSDEQHDPTITITGSPQGVEQARHELQEIANRLANEKSKDVIMERRFHPIMIGPHGSKISDIRKNFPDVIITFPDASANSDIVNLRGPKDEVDRCAKYLMKEFADMQESNYQEDVKIFKKFHKNIIGKNGAMIKKIREETNTRIDVPAEDSTSDAIVVTGKKKDVQQAREKIEKMQEGLFNTVEEQVNIPPKFHNALIGAKGAHIKQIIQESGDIIIRFPRKDKKEDDKVTIRGTKEDVVRAKKLLLQLAEDMKVCSYSEEVRTPREFHRFLIGRKGTNISKLRESTDTRFVFPETRDSSAPNDVITIVGKEENVKKARQELEKMIEGLKTIVEDEMQVPQKHHRHFLQRSGKLVNEIAAEFGGITISFPKQGTASERVMLKGPKDCVDGAKLKMEEVIRELEQTVTIEVHIPQKHHRSVIGANGVNVQRISQEHNVQIKFPDRKARGEKGERPDRGERSNRGERPNRRERGHKGERADKVDEADKVEEADKAEEADKEEPAEKGDDKEDIAEPQVNGDVNGHEDQASEEQPAAHNEKSDLVFVTGLRERCEAARDALLASVPITEEVQVPIEYHGLIIGSKGSGIQTIRETCNVEISIPPRNKNTDVITITGTPDNVEEAKKLLDERVEQLKKEEDERKLKSFTVTVDVDAKYHPKIIGRNGTVITKIREKHDVRISFPDDKKNGDANPNTITILGFESAAEAAREEILKMVGEYENQTTVEIELDARIFPRLIGKKGHDIRRFMDKNRVDIRFPPSTAKNPNLVTISGLEENVEDSIEQLKSKQDELLEAFFDYEQYMAPSARDNARDKPKQQNPGYVVKDAPWAGAAPPDTQNQEEFPSFGAVTTPSGSSGTQWVRPPRK